MFMVKDTRARNIKQIQMANNFQRLRNHATIVDGVNLLK